MIFKAGKNIKTNSSKLRNIIFSNKYFFFKIQISLILIVMACLYSNWKGRSIEVTYEKCLSDPDKYDQALVYFYYGNITKVKENGFYFNVKDNIYFIKNTKFFPNKNKTLDIQVRFTKGSTIELTDFQYSKKFPITIKKGISAIALIIAFFMFAKDYGLAIDKSGICFKKNTYA
ncbi:MAG: hypothetical protein ACMUIU_09695 [bacterium]